MNDRRDFRGNQQVAQARYFDRVRQANAWRKDKIAKLRMAVEKWVGSADDTTKNTAWKAVETAMLAIRLPAGRPTDLGFQASDKAWYCQATRDHLVTGWTDRDGRAHLGLGYVLDAKIRTRRELNEQLHRNGGQAPRGLAQRRDEVDQAIRGIAPRVKAMETFLSLLETK